MARLYRGSDIRSLNSNEFLTGKIKGSRYEVIEVDFPDTLTVDDFKYQSIESWDTYITRRMEVPITGGLSDDLPAAIKFTKHISPPGAVLHIDSAEVAGQIRKIQYNPEWFDNNPGALAEVSTLWDGELREDGRIIALLRVDPSKTVISEPRRSQVESEATSNTYSSEHEYLAFADDIDISGSIKAIVLYLGTTGTSPYTIRHALTELPGYYSSMGTVLDNETRDVIAGPDDYRKHAEALYTEMKELIDHDAPLYLVAVESRNDVRGDDGRISPDNFRFVYNGRGFDTDYGRNSALLGGVA